MQSWLQFFCIILYLDDIVTAWKKKSSINTVGSLSLCRSDGSVKMLVAYRAWNIDQINLISITQLSADQLFRTNDPDTKGQVKGVANIYLASGKNVDLKSNQAVMHSSTEINQDKEAMLCIYQQMECCNVGKCHQENILCQFIKNRKKRKRTSSRYLVI